MFKVDLRKLVQPFVALIVEISANHVCTNAQTAPRTTILKLFVHITIRLPQLCQLEHEIGSNSIVTIVAGSLLLSPLGRFRYSQAACFVVG